jgi:hypothetical protein
MRFITKVLLAGLFCSTLAAVEDGFAARIGFGLTNVKEEASYKSISIKTSESGSTFDVYGGYRMQNAQFGLSYANINCEGCDANYVLASGAYVFENLHNVIKPFLGLGIGLFKFEASDINFDENALFGTVNLGVNIEFDNFFTGVELRRQIFGGIDKDYDLYGYDFNYEANPKQTYLFYVGYKF